MSRFSRPRATSPVGGARARSNLTEHERRGVYDRLLAVSVDDLLPRTAYREVAEHFHCSPCTVKRVWARGQRSIAAGSLATVVTSKICGIRAHAGDIEAKIKAVPHHLRQPLRSLASQAAIPKTALIWHMKASTRLKARSSYVRPMLTDANKRARLASASSFVRPSSGGTNTFVNMHDYVHVDEKWFYLTKVKRRFYVYDDEKEFHQLPSYWIVPRSAKEIVDKYINVNTSQHPIRLPGHLHGAMVFNLDQADKTYFADAL
ncbi:hypothetical protein ACHHYP_20544 [Achlya hypogyna]|uniref:DUF7769 domain-containing protein n=1 Tax=Achlya hypogyna TaxID=1202772 RepID=A0A1V9YJ72_ACHHY|nr:hypothetical protein ACHHYP_20544 [Achlya hypogyna]